MFDVRVNQHNNSQPTGRNMKYTIITGNPVDGFRALGVFNNNEEAVYYGSMDSAMIGDWSIMEIQEIQRPRPTKSEMIEMLIKSDLEDCNDVKDLKEILRSFLLAGCKGYQNWTELDLRDEVVGRELI